MIQCARCGARMEDSAIFCGSCGSTEFVAATAENGAMPNGSATAQGNPVPEYQQANYQQMNNQQQAGPMPGYQQANYQQQGGPMPGYQQANYQQMNNQQQAGPMPGYQQPNYQQGGYQQQGISAPNYQPHPFMFQNVPPDLNRATVSRGEFLKKYADPGLQKEWRSIGIFFYIVGGLSILLALIMTSILDLIFCLTLLGLAMGMHLGVNKVCAIMLLVLSCLDTVLCLITYGTPGGWLWILVGAMAITKIGKINTQYKQFRSGMFY